MKVSESSSTATRRPSSPGSFSTPRPERFTIGAAGPALDPRRWAFRRDLAEIALAGRAFAPHYAAPEQVEVGPTSVMLHAGPSLASPAVSQLVRGEGFALLDSAGGWSWGKCLHDDYVGYLPSHALRAPQPASHRVSVPLALGFEAPSIKSFQGTRLPFGSHLDGVVEGDFLRTDSGFFHLRHVEALDVQAADPVAVAERFLGQPYLWGGRGGGGIDCSGLVQVALAAAGLAPPRDSDQQRAELGEALAPAAVLRRGDLVFMPGHVGLMVDEARLIHANAHWMAVTVEPLADVLARAGEGIEITRRRIA